MVNDIVIMMPVYNPDEKFINFLKDLSLEYTHIIVVDDGSREDTKHYFTAAVEQYHCDLVRHYVNLGQGRAFKSGFNYFMGHYADDSDIIGVVECDCDGQHILEDVDECARLLRENKDKFILGVRNFDDKKIPFRSRFGNKCTNLVFRIFCGLNLKDTQTGLKGIPKSFVPALMETQGERFEYASSVLLETKKEGYDIIQFPIRTIYINENETSHFNPLIDSLRIYSLIFKYTLSSLSSFIVDIVLYSLFLAITIHFAGDYYIIISTYMAKVFSCTYGYFVNKNLVFARKNNTSKWIPIKFFTLCIVQSTCSGLLTSGLAFLTHWNPVLCKIVIDTILFFASFQIQNRWIFNQKQK